LQQQQHILFSMPSISAMEDSLYRFIILQYAFAVDVRKLCLITRPVVRILQQGDQKPEGGAKNQKGDRIFKIQYWMYAATGGPNVKWEGTDFKLGGRAPLAPPVATTLLITLISSEKFYYDCGSLYCRLNCP